MLDILDIKNTATIYYQADLAVFIKTSVKEVIGDLAAKHQ